MLYFCDSVGMSSTLKCMSTFVLVIDIDFRLKFVSFLHCLILVSLHEIHSKIAKVKEVKSLYVLYSCHNHIEA